MFMLPNPSVAVFTLNNKRAHTRARVQTHTHTHTHTHTYGRTQALTNAGCVVPGQGSWEAWTREEAHSALCPCAWACQWGCPPCTPGRMGQPRSAQQAESHQLLIRLR